MIVTTTPQIEGREIAEYKGLVFAEVATGITWVKDIAASFRNLVGGRSSHHEEAVSGTRMQAIEEMVQRARNMGANAIVGARFEYEMIGQQGTMLLVIASGTAVVLR